jgi:Septin
LGIFGLQILQEIHQHKIKIYEFPDSPDDDEEAKQNAKLKARVPFAVVGSNTVLEVEGGKRVRGRRYPWGVAEGNFCGMISNKESVLKIQKKIKLQKDGQRVSEIVF